MRIVAWTDSGEKQMKRSSIMPINFLSGGNGAKLQHHAAHFYGKSFHRSVVTRQHKETRTFTLNYVKT